MNLTKEELHILLYALHDRALRCGKREQECDNYSEHRVAMEYREARKKSKALQDKIWAEISRRTERGEW